MIGTLTPEMQLGIALRRIATATSIIRTRAEQEIRNTNHGTVINEHVKTLLFNLEQVADDLENDAADMDRTTVG